MPWDPNRYLRFADQRTRPGLELIARIPDVAAGTIVDLGCGTGHLTALLAERWPNAAVLGIDSSDEMIERARGDHPAMRWVVDDIESWAPDDPIDIIFSNATLHWLDDHERLFRKLRSSVAAGGVIAVQMPDNWGEPTHQIPAHILDTGDWPVVARAALLRDRLANPGEYSRWLQPASIDMWRTTYYQRLTGHDPVWEWVGGSLLRPVFAALDEPERERFSELCRRRYAEAYPADPDGSTTLPFHRLFMVANTRAARSV